MREDKTVFQVEAVDGGVRQARVPLARPDGGVAKDPEVQVTYVPKGAICTMPALGGYGYVGVAAPESGFVVAQRFGSTVFVTVRALAQAEMERAKTEIAAEAAAQVPIEFEPSVPAVDVDGAAGDLYAGHDGDCPSRAGGECGRPGPGANCAYVSGAGAEPEKGPSGG